MAQLRPKIVKLAKVIGGVSGMVVKIDENAPEYYCMANIVSDDEADIAIAAGLRKNDILLTFYNENAIKKACAV